MDASDHNKEEDKQLTPIKPLLNSKMGISSANNLRRNVERPESTAQHSASKLFGHTPGRSDSQNLEPELSSTRDEGT